MGSRDQHLRYKFALLIPALLAIAVLIGCGGSQSSPGNGPSSPGTSSGAPGTAAPSPGTGGGSSPSPSPSPGPTPSPSTAPDSYLATIICCSFSKTQSAEGQITVDATVNNGAGNVQITNSGGNVGVNESLVLQFCPFPQNFANCINVTSLTTNANGNANVNFTFPQKGTFSGFFQFVSNGNQVLVTASASTNGVNFKSAELSAATITGGINQTTASAKGGGTITVTGTTPHLVLSSTLPNHTFHVAACGINGSCTALIDSVVFTLSDSSGVEFISAFRVQ